ncbi:MAG: DNA mismatch repair protein MutS [Rikenellaceae bacterium]|nr:DNA mismatch repair protein MutS [Rikenellaceae bacterium]MCL2692637.1 DNA mismatch repair protein MutS [Rikenellaceae bacterium]
MTDLRGFYIRQLSELNACLSNSKARRNVYLALKLVLFAGAAVAGYYAIAGRCAWVFPVALFATYFVALYFDGRAAAKQLGIKELIADYEAELRYLDGDLSGFATGAEFASPDHCYSLDLDLFGENSLFAEMNRTVTPNGKRRLATHLQNPFRQAEPILRRQVAVAELASPEHNRWMHEFRAKGRIHAVADWSPDVVEQWQRTRYFRNGRFGGGLLILNVLCLASLAAAIAGFIPYGAFIVAAMLQLLVTIFTMGALNRQHARLDKTIKSLAGYFYLIDHVAKAEFRSEELVALKAETDSAITAFGRLKKIKAAFDRRGNVLMTIVLNSLYLRDLHTLRRLIVWRGQYAAHIDRWTAAVEEIDALLSAANYRFNHPYFILPAIDPDGRILAAEGIAHPMMRGADVVENDFTVAALHEIYILTGANMSGKSTFLRSVGLNLVLALTGNVVRSRAFSFTPVALFTSMRTSDNLSRGQSYFQAELLRLSALHDMARDGRPVFIILDEMLKGTNSQDKLNGSLKFLARLLQFNISGIVATHDLALGALADSHPHNFRNLCFEIDHADDEIIYTYKLRDGVSKNMNASFLLRKMDLI